MRNYDFNITSNYSFLVQDSNNQELLDFMILSISHIKLALE